MRSKSCAIFSKSRQYWTRWRQTSIRSSLHLCCKVSTQNSQRCFANEFHDVALNPASLRSHNNVACPNADFSQDCLFPTQTVSGLQDSSSKPTSSLLGSIDKSFFCTKTPKRRLSILEFSSNISTRPWLRKICVYM